MANNLEILSEVAHRCDDIGFKDFDKGAYRNALYRANRLVARKYHILQKLLVFTLSNKTSDYTADMVIDLPDMKEEILVSVNGVNLRKKDNQILDNKDMYCYYLFRQPDGTYLFNYANGMPLEGDTLVYNPDISASANTGLTDRVDTTNSFGKSSSDEIVILYEVIPERDYDETEYFIPSNYEEEQIELAVFHIAKLGIPKFTGEKANKYTKLYRLYSRRSDYDKEVVESSEPIKIQIFQYP